MVTAGAMQLNPFSKSTSLVCKERKGLFGSLEEVPRRGFHVVCSGVVYTHTD
jgi:hypothetical protein